MVPDAVPADPPGTLAGDLVATGEGYLRLLAVQPAGKGPMDARAWLRGARPGHGARLGSEVG